MVVYTHSSVLNYLQWKWHTVLAWPASFPDLKPNENFWGKLKCTVNKNANANTTLAYNLNQLLYESSKSCLGIRFSAQSGPWQLERGHVSMPMEDRHTTELLIVLRLLTDGN